MQGYAVNFLTVLSAVLTVQTVGDHLRSGGSIISVVPENPRAGSAEAAVKAALSNWVAGQAAVFGTRGITVNAVAAGRGTQPGYDGLSSTPPSLTGLSVLARSSPTSLQAHACPRRREAVCLPFRHCDGSAAGPQAV